MADLNTLSIYRAKLRRLWSFPGVLLPTLIGGLGLAFHGAPDGPFSYGLAALLLIGLSTAVSRWFSRGPELTQRALQDLQNRARREQHRQLNRLRGDMRADRDPRTSQLVRQLQQLYDRAAQSDPRYAANRPNASVALLELLGQFDELYHSSLTLLVKTLQIWQAARGMSTDDARHQMLESREKLIEEVTASVKNLEVTLDSLQTAQFELRDLGDSENARLREELQRNLEVARQVERRLEEMERGFRPREQI